MTEGNTRVFQYDFDKIRKLKANGMSTVTRRAYKRLYAMPWKRTTTIQFALGRPAVYIRESNAHIALFQLCWFVKMRVVMYVITQLIDARMARHLNWNIELFIIRSYEIQRRN